MHSSNDPPHDAEPAQLQPRLSRTTAEQHPDRPDIRRFSDYRQFLRAFVPFLRETRPGFSYRNFAKRAGFASPNYLKLVSDGLRNLAPESADKFSLGLGLNKREQDVFRLLVQLANARTDEERNATFARLRDRVIAHETARLRDDQLSVYEMWWALIVREMANLPGFRLDAEWIAKQLRPRIRVTDARRAIELLVRIGLLVPTESGGATPAEKTVTTGPEVTALAVRNYHRAHLALAAQALDEVAREARNITSCAVILTPAQYDEVIVEIGKLRRRILEIADHQPKPPTEGAPASDTVEPTREVYQALFALFPVTQGTKQ